VYHHRAMQQICCICIHSGSANVVLEIYDTSWSKTEFLWTVARTERSHTRLFGGEAIIPLSGFANSQNNRQSTKLYYVTLKLAFLRVESLSTAIGTDPPSPPPSFSVVQHSHRLWKRWPGSNSTKYSQITHIYWIGKQQVHLSKHESKEWQLRYSL